MRSVGEIRHSFFVINQLSEKVESVQDANSVYSGGVQLDDHQKQPKNKVVQMTTLIPDPAKTNENLINEVEHHFDD